MDTSSESSKLHTPNDAPAIQFKRGATGYCFIFGVILPCIVLGFEWVTNGCADIFFDPLPTVLHSLLVAWVPWANWRALRQTRAVDAGPPSGWLFFGLSAAMTISGLYAFAFLPITHAAVVGILFFGIGFLPLSPVLAFIASVLLYRRLCRLKAASPAEIPWVTDRASPIWAGFMVSITLLCIAEFPRIATIAGVEMVESHRANERARGIWLLRTIGETEMLREAAIGRNRSFYGEFLGLDISPQEARRIFYRVTGHAHNEELREDQFSLFGNTRQSMLWDQDLGGTQVGQKLPDVSLIESRIDGVLYPSTSSGYLEWTMVFRNDNEWLDREARFILRPPSGGVVSRVTLWINGEPREAAFGKTAQVREAYESVAVRQRRDPLLVTSLGPDLVLVQCFPILPDGETMQIRLGMSIPLEASTDGWQDAPWPRIVDQNFNDLPGLEHSIWLEAPGALKLDHSWMARAAATTGDSELRTRIPDSEIDDGSIRLAVEGVANEPLVAMSPVDGQVFALTPTRHIAPRDNALVVVDGSRDIRSSLGEVIAWLSQRDSATLWFAGDEVERFAGSGDEAADWLRGRRYVGGQDSLPALTMAMEHAMDNRAGADKTIWWFYGSQPLILASPDRLQRLYERGDPNVSIVACPLGEPVNRLREFPPLAYAPTARGPDFAWQSIERRKSPEPASAGPEAGREHLFRVAFADDVRRNLSTLFRSQAKHKRSVYNERLDTLAGRAALAQIVTPLTGAVVLETQAQYDAHNLDPVNPDSVPTVPEPAMAALIIGVLLLVALACLKAKGWKGGRCFRARGSCLVGGTTHPR